jgi:hypothetical protein
MSTRVLVCFFIIVVNTPLVCLGQHLVPALTVEKNVAGCEYGASVTYQTKSLISFGAFYQTGLPIHKTEAIATPKNFTGGVFYMPLSKSQNLNFYMQSRIGFVDERFFVFAPGVETEMHLAGNLWIHVGAGLRMTYPSLMTKISIKL